MAIDNRTIVHYDGHSFYWLIVMPYSLHQTITAPAISVKGAANGDGSYSAELIGYVEIVTKGA